MGLIIKIIGIIILLALIAAFIDDPRRFIAALKLLWEGIKLLGQGILYVFEHLPGWLEAIKNR